MRASGWMAMECDLCRLPLTHRLIVGLAFHIVSNPACTPPDLKDAILSSFALQLITVFLRDPIRLLVSDQEADVFHASPSSLHGTQPGSASLVYVGEYAASTSIH